MAEKFDPYYRWLGIPAKEQPPNHYRLLGMELFESDPQLIDSFALRHTCFLREVTDGPHLPDAQRLLNELAAARRCLLDPQRKAAYDAELRERLAAADKPLSSADDVIPPPPPAVAAGPPWLPPSPSDAPPIAVAVRNESDSPPTGADPRRIKAGRPPTWLLAGCVAVTLVAIGFTGALLVRSMLSRPASATATARKGSGQPTVANAPAAERRPLERRKLEPPAKPVPASSPTAAPARQPDSESATSVASKLASEMPSARKSFVPEGVTPRLPGLVLWLDASQLAPADGRIARWSDASGGNYVAQPKQESQRPEVLPQTLDGKAVARFRGGQWLEISGTSQRLNLGSDYTIAYVARGVAGTLLSKGSGGKAGQFSLLSDSCFLTNGELNASSGGRLAATGDDPAQFRVRTIAADGTACNWFVDGAASGNYSGDQHEIQNTTVLRIGSPQFRSGQEDATQFFIGDLAELLIYNRALPEDARQGVEKYLRDKWLSGGQSPAPLDLVAVPAQPSSAAEVATTDAPQTSSASAVAEPAAGYQLAETGAIRREAWRNTHGIGLDAVHELWAERPEPDQSETVDRFESPTDFDDNYCQRFRGFLQPPATGDYTFSVRANEDAVLFVSPDEKPENKRQVIGKDKVALTAGRAYYVEAIHREKGGKDYFSVGWRLPDGSEENPIPGGRLSLRDRPIPPHGTGFVALTPVRVEASGGTQLRILDDGAVLADGATKENEVYRLVFETQLPTITAFQLHAVPHESLPGGGPGVGLGGSFRLAEFQVAVGSTDGDTAAETVKFREVLTLGDDSGEGRLIDGNPATVWSSRRGGQPVSLTFLPTGPIRTSGTAWLNVTLHNRENLGCFRLLATSMSEPRQPAKTGGSQPQPVRSDLLSLFVNLGGGPWHDPAGNSWLPSKDFDGATFGHEGGQAIKSDAVEHPLYGTAVRRLSVRAVVPNGEYRVELHFHEHWSHNPADRAFVVTVEQQPVLPPPIFFQGPGMGQQPYVHSINKVTVKDGRLDVDFRPALPGSLTILNGIAIRQLR